jgi:hypothetical protein
MPGFMSTDQFRVGMFTYPWDFEGEGYDRVVGEMASHGVTHVDMATAYHAGKFLLPHNPRHRTYFTEDGAIFFRPDLARYGRLRPRVSALVDDAGDPVSRLREATQRHGVAYAAWTVLMHNSWIGMQFPDVAVHTAFGDPVVHSLNPAHPDVREYVVALLSDLVAGREVEAVLLEAPGYLRYTHGWHHEINGVALDAVQEDLLSISFSPHEVEAATAEGIDAGGVRDAVARLLDRAWNEGFALSDGEASHPEAVALLSDPDLRAYTQWQRDQVVSLSQELRNAVKALSPDTEILHMAALDGGVADPALLETADRILAGYAASDDDAIAKASALRPLGRKVHGMVRGLPPDTVAPGQLTRRLAAWKMAGVDGVDCYNYGFMSRRSLEEWYAALA